MLDLLILAGLVLLAAFTQGGLGFGFGLVAMASIAPLEGYRFTLVLVAILATLVNVAVLIRYRRAFVWRSAAPLMAGVLVGAPLGAFFATRIDETVALRLLGALLIVYSLDRLLRGRRTEAPSTPADRPPIDYAALPFGLGAGVMGGAFNTGGPIAILYCARKAWSPATFKAILQGVFLTNSAVQLPIFAAEGLIDGRLCTMALGLVPVLLVGIVLGSRLSNRLPRATFERAVLVALLAIGVTYVLR